MKHLFTLLFLTTFSLISYSQMVIEGFDVSALPGGTNNYGPNPLSATTTNANVTTTGLNKGSGVGNSNSGAARGWGGTGFNFTTAANAIAGNVFFVTTVTGKTGYLVSYSTIDYNYRRSGTGPTTGLIQYSIDGTTFIDITTVSYSSSTSSGAALSSIDLSGIADLQNVTSTTTVSIRIIPYGASGAAGSSYIFDVAASSDPDFAINGTVQTVLPLSISNLNASKQNKKVSLGWNLGCTSNQVTYAVERSANGISFSPIETKTVSQQRCEQPFQFTDAAPLQGTNYYRIKSSNIDGEVKYSEIATVNFDNGSTGIKVFPTLTTGHATIYYESAQAGKAVFHVMDMNGRTVKSIKANINAGANNLPVDISNLASGKYFIQGIQGNNKIPVVSIIKQ